MKKYAYLLASSLLLASCGTGVESSEALDVNPIITINLSNNKSITCELYKDVAPITVDNFLSLIKKDFYNDTIFHRVIKDFMVQGGGYYIKNNTIYTKEADTIKGEFSNNGVENNIHHEAGVLSMARATDKNSASSQFFICVAECSWLDGDYAAFGKVVDEESLNAAIEMSTVQTTTIGGVLQNFPVDPISIVNIKIKN